MSLEILQQWGMENKNAQLVMDALHENKKVIIIGSVGTGKSKLLNELIRMKPTDQHFQYRAKQSVNDYELELDNQTRIARSLWGASFLVIDELPYFLKQNLNYPQPILATYIVSDPQQQFQFERDIQPFYDVVITLNGYKAVWNVRKITIHDRLLYNSNRILEQTKDENKSNYPFETPFDLTRSHWLTILTPAEKAAVQFAAMNKSVETGGMSGWYQEDGAIITQDIHDLVNLASYGQANGIRGFAFLHEWLIRVRDEYLPAIREMDVDDYNEPEISDTLASQYWAWENRFDQFDELLELLNKSESNEVKV